MVVSEYDWLIIIIIIESITSDGNRCLPGSLESEQGHVNEGAFSENEMCLEKYGLLLFLCLDSSNNSLASVFFHVPILLLM